MKEGEGGGKARQPAVVAADMEPCGSPQAGAGAGDPADRGGVKALGRAEEGDRARPRGEQARQLGDHSHGADGELAKASRRRVTSWSSAAGGAARPATQSTRSASAQSISVS